MTKPHLVWSASITSRPLAKLSQAEKLANAISFLRSRGKYILDIGTPTPQWGHGLDKLERSK